MDVNELVTPMFDIASNLIHDFAIARIGFAVGGTAIIIGAAYSFRKFKNYIKYDVIGF